MNKVIRDGKVAVLYSPGYGAGWSTWTSSKKRDIALFHPKLVEMVESGKRLEITDEWAQKNLGISLCTLGNDQLEIEWIEQGSSFHVNEYDGSESIIFGSLDMVKA